MEEDQRERLESRQPTTQHDHWKRDTKLVAEVTRTAITTLRDERTTIVVVTGDADVIPALDDQGRKMEDRSVHVEAGTCKRHQSYHKERIVIKHLYRLLPGQSHFHKHEISNLL